LQVHADKTVVVASLSLNNRTPIQAPVGEAFTRVRPANTLFLPNSDTSTAPGASVILNIGKLELESAPTTYENLLRFTPSPVVAISQGGDTGIARLLTQRLGEGAIFGKIKGIAGELLQRISQGLQNQTQTASIQDATPVGAVQSTDAGRVSASRNRTELNLTIKSQSGAQVQLLVTEKDRSLAISTDVKGDLTAEEQKAIAALAKGVEKALAAFADGGSDVDIQSLVAADPKVLTYIDLHIEKKMASVTSGELVSSFSFKANAQERRYQLTTPEQSIDVRVKSNPLTFSATTEQREKAIARYIAQLDRAADRSHESVARFGSLASVFSSLQRTTPTNASSVGGALTRHAVDDNDNAVLSGLADFEVQFRTARQSPNPLKPQETDGIQFDTKQSTSATVTPSSRTIRQSQEAHLIASYHLTLDGKAAPKLDATKASQNYSYTRIEDHASSEISIAHVPNQQTQVEVAKSASQSTHVQRFEAGKLVKDLLTPLQRSVRLSLSDQFSKLEDFNNRAARSDVEKAQIRKALHEQSAFETDPAALKS
jgi:hypothetical protein